MSFITSGSSYAAVIKVGVLEHRGHDATFRLWKETVTYIDEVVLEHQFELVSLAFDDVERAVANKSIDFVLVNPSIYVALETRHRVSRIATLSRIYEGERYNQFAGVIFTRRDRQDLKEESDLRNMRFAAVHPESLGGFQMAWRELAKTGVDPYTDTKLTFMSTHDEVVRAVIQGRADVGTVRTSILEHMVGEGAISLDDVKVLGQRENERFPFVHSTTLYPEWPFSKLAHTPTELAQRVAVALLNLPVDHLAARTGYYAGWTVPLDYQFVHELLRELKLKPYENMGKFTLVDVMTRYRYWIFFSILAFVAITVLAVWVWRLNFALQREKNRLESRHELILDSVGEGIYGIDQNGNATFINQTMEKLTGWKIPDVVGKNQHQLLHHTRMDGSKNDPDKCPVCCTANDGKPRFVYEDLFWRADGSSFPVEYSTNPVVDERKNTAGAVVVFRDITKRIEAEKRERTHMQELAHVARLSTMGEMASTIAHELNQPLAAISNYTEGCIVALESGRDDQQKMVDIMGRVSEQAQRAGEIIRQLRRFIRKGEGKFQPVAINDVVRRIEAMLRSEILQSSVRFERDLDRSEPLVRAEEIQIEQVLLNLLKNAIEAMAESELNHRRLSVRTFRGNSDTVTTAITDTGPGLDGAIADHLFEPFQTTKPDGMGLGLSICKSIIEAHGGQLTASSTETGTGTVFTFHLPAADVGLE